MFPQKFLIDCIEMGFSHFLCGFFWQMHAYLPHMVLTNHFGEFSLDLFVPELIATPGD